MGFVVEVLCVGGFIFHPGTGFAPKPKRQVQFGAVSGIILQVTCPDVVTGFFIIFNSNWVKMSRKPSTTQSR